VGARLAALLLGRDDAAAYCLLAVEGVYLLSPLVACAEIMLRLHHAGNGDAFEPATQYIAILGRESLPASWRFLLLHHTPPHHAGAAHDSEQASG
jgi:hypothetical protein